MHARNSVRQRWAAGDVALDCWVSGVSMTIAEAIGRLPCDAVVIDMQHTPADLRDVTSSLIALAGTGATAIVRVPGNDAALIQKVLDAGADGVMCPMVNSRAEAEELVAAVRYPPLGRRSFGPWRPAVGAANYYARANDELIAIAQIETLEALAAIDEIAAVPGLDVLYAGAADLAVSAGEDPLVSPADDAEAAARVRAIADAAHRAGKRAGMLALSAAEVELAHACGMDLVSVGIEQWLVVDAARTALADARAILSRRETAPSVAKGGS